MRTQENGDTKNRVFVSCLSAENFHSQIARLKKTVLSNLKWPNHHFKRYKMPLNDLKIPQNDRKWPHMTLRDLLRSNIKKSKKNR